MQQKLNLSCRLLKGAVTCAMLGVCNLSLAGPEGGNTNGTGVITASQTTTNDTGISRTWNTTVVTQSAQAPRLDVSWNSFNLAYDDRVIFQQSSSSSVAINRIGDANPSTIAGRLDANGRVLLINPNGLYFGGAQVNVGALVASTLPLHEINGSTYCFGLPCSGAGVAPSSPGVVRMDGSVIVARRSDSAAPAPGVAILGGTVTNSGTIQAEGGVVFLGNATGGTVTFPATSDLAGLLTVQINASNFSPMVRGGVRNSGTLSAAGGVIMLRGDAGSVLDYAINQTGVLQASRVNNANGLVQILGSGATHVDGDINAHEVLIDASNSTGEISGIHATGPVSVGLYSGRVSDISSAGDVSISMGSFGGPIYLGRISGANVRLRGEGSFLSDGGAGRVVANSLDIASESRVSLNTQVSRLAAGGGVIDINNVGDLVLGRIGNGIFGTGKIHIATVGGNIHLTETINVPLLVSPPPSQSLVLDAGSGTITAAPGVSIRAETSSSLDYSDVVLRGSRIGSRENPLSVQFVHTANKVPTVAVLLQEIGQQDPANLSFVTAGIYAPATNARPSINVFNGGDVNVSTQVVGGQVDILGVALGNFSAVTPNFFALQAASKARVEAVDAAVATAASLDVGAPDVSAFDTSVSLFGSTGGGIRLPADQSDETEQAAALQ